MTSTLVSDLPESDDGALCRACDGTTRMIVDAGPQPITNRYPATRGGETFRFEMVVAVCEVCALVQLVRPPSPADVRPREHWIASREPESHLDALADRVMATFDRDRTPPMALGVGDNDIALLSKLEQRGAIAVQFEWRKEIVPTELFSATETLANWMSPEIAAVVATRIGRADLVVAQNLLEHAQQPGCLLGGLRELASPGGRLVLEVPDCSAGLVSPDPSILWEEHVSYFTPATLRRSVCRAGWDAEWVEPFPGVGQIDALFRLPEPSRREDLVKGGIAERSEITQAIEFGSSLDRLQERWRELLSDARDRGNRIALYGSGHSGIVLVNVLGLGDLFDVAIDDNPHKAGRFLPGSYVPILPFAEISRNDRYSCVLALGADTERRVLEARKDWISAGTNMISISPVSPLFPAKLRTP